MVTDDGKPTKIGRVRSILHRVEISDRNLERALKDFATLGPIH